jgi:hypothetical protein
MAHVEILRETPNERTEGKWQLCFQWCRYVYDDGSTQQGYRFIWRRPNGNLQAGRGQARIPSIEQAMALMRVAEAEGWGGFQGEGGSLAGDAG